MDKQILMSFADIPEETVERFRETFQQSKQLMTYYSCALLEVETKFRGAEPAVFPGAGA